jgi:hypothetical protein
MATVIYKGKSEAERIRDRLKNASGRLGPDSVVETNPVRTITSTFHSAAHVSPSKYEHDPVAALARAKAALKE